MRRAVARAAGIARSLVIYYGQAWRRRRMDQFYRQFISRGALCFDVGAHAGNRIGSWLRLGARVVAIEPQPDFFGLLERLYGRRAEVTLLACGVGERPGRKEMLISSRTPTVSTFSREWIEQVSEDPRFAVVDWDRRVEVEIETLDRLIERHGEPAFCKIDVEGFEQEVLAGLSRPLRALSFEYIPIARERAAACVDRLGQLGDYRFRQSPKETMRWTTGRWLGPEEVKADLEELPGSAPPGDIYALRSDALDAGA